MLDRQFVLNLANQIANFQQRNNGYLARQELERLHSELCHDEKRLEPFGFKVYSQGDEDGIIEEICRRLKMTLGTFFEIGVENGLECNSLYLIHRGWKGCWIEGNQNYCDFNPKKKCINYSKTAAAISKTVSVDNINSLIVEAVSIDTVFENSCSRLGIIDAFFFWIESQIILISFYPAPFPSSVNQI